MCLYANEIRYLGAANASNETMAYVAEVLTSSAHRRVMSELVAAAEAREEPAITIAVGMMRLAEQLEREIAIVCQCAALEQRYCRCGAMHAARWLK